MVAAEDKRYLEMAIEQSRESAKRGGFPAGAVVVKDGKIISKGLSLGFTVNDPTIHGEVDAIRKACKALGTMDLSGATLYDSLQPCLMCFSAAAWANMSRIVYACRREKVSEEYYISKIQTPEANRSIKKKIELVHIPELEDKALEVVREWEKSV